MLDAHAHGKRLRLHRHALRVQRLKGVAGAVPDGEQHAGGGDDGRFAALRRAHAGDAAILGHESRDLHAEADLAAVVDDRLAQILHDRHQLVRADVRLGVVEDIGARARPGKLLEDPADALVFDAGVQLPVGERPRAALAELHVALRVERPGLPEFQHGRVPRLGVLPALEHERAQPRHAEHQRGEHPRRAEPDDHGPLRRDGPRLRNVIDRVLREGSPGAVGHLEDLVLPALDRHVDGINDAHVVFLPCVDGPPLQIQLLDLIRGDAQLPRRGLDEPDHIAVRRQRDITDADHRVSSCFPSIPAT